MFSPKLLPKALAQNNPGIVLKTKHFGTTLEPRYLGPFDLPNDVWHKDNEEWIFSIVEDTKGDIINAGFVEPKEDKTNDFIDNYGGTHKWPALVKINSNLEFMAEKIY